MKRKVRITVLGLIVVGVGLSQQVSLETSQHVLTPVELLRLLMQDPSLTPVYEEGLRVMDQIASMSPDQLRGTLPVIFEALYSRVLMAQMDGALALYSVAIRADGKTYLNPRTDEILGLISLPDPRLQATAVIVAERMAVPAAKITPVYTAFLADPRQPDQVKAAVVSGLIRMTAISAGTARVISDFMSATSSVSVRVDTVNAIASNPSDNPIHADLVTQCLRDPSEQVRNAAIYALQRLGPKAVAYASPSLLQLTNDPNESSNIRESARRVIELRR